MNDFTKEELEMIDMDLTTTILKHGKENCSDEYIALAKKVNGMIDNHCEHTKRQYYEHVAVYECEKCHMVSMT